MKSLSAEAYDLHPVRILARRVLLQQRERSVGRDREDRDRVRQFAADDHIFAIGVDAEAARLLLDRRAREVGELAGCTVDAERAERATGALRGVQGFPKMGLFYLGKSWLRLPILNCEID